MTFCFPVIFCFLAISCLTKTAVRPHWAADSWDALDCPGDALHRSADALDCPENPLYCAGCTLHHSGDALSEIGTAGLAVGTAVVPSHAVLSRDEVNLNFGVTQNPAAHAAHAAHAALHRV